MKNESMFITDVYTDKKEILEALREYTGAKYISDLKNQTYNAKARYAVSKISVEQYPMNTLEDIAEYIFSCKIKFKNMNEAKRFFSTETESMHG